MVIRDTLYKEIEKIAPSGVRFTLERPERFEFGDYSTNVALGAADDEKNPPAGGPRELADAYVAKLQSAGIAGVEKIEVAGAGFINFFLQPSVFVENLARILKEKESYGRNQTNAGKKIIIEYTDPNPFKEFHIGHLMSNAIGEALARLFEASGADVRRVNYQGDVGLHVAKAVWAMERRKISLAGLRIWGSSSERMHFLGAAYAYGNAQFDTDPEAKAAIERINKELYEGREPFLRAHNYYRIGRAWSLDYFDAMYARLGTAFDFYFFESETGVLGKKIVEEGMAKNIFEKSEGAVVFKGEPFGLHTRVFLNSEGLPTYEAKELGLAQMKREKFPYDLSISVTGNEVVEYFRVVFKAMEQLWGSDVVKSLRHIPHGMLRLPEGKMSSRTGKVITADALLEDVAGKLKARVRGAIADAVAVGAIKYSILRQASGRDIIFDFDKSLSFEGDSGPYLQYAHARMRSVVDKAQGAGVRASVDRPDDIGVLEKILFAFPDVVMRAEKELAPHHIATYLIEVARAFNHYYAEERIADAGDKAPYRTALAAATATVLKNGLNLLGIAAPERM